VVVATDAVDTVAALLGAIAAGGVGVPLHPGLGEQQRRAIVADADADLVVTPGRDRLPDRSRSAGLPGGGDPEATALLLYTSGTTSEPKAVVARHRNVVFATEAIQARLGYEPDDVVFTALPLAFDYGLYQVFLALVSGACVVLENPDAGPPLLSHLVGSGATVVPVVPGIATRLLRLAARGARRSADTRVRLFTNTGDVLGVAERAGLRGAFPGAAIVPMFGLTECKRVTIAAPDEDLTCPTGLGTALPGTHIEVVGHDGRPQPPGVEGELVVAGPHVMAGYWRAPDLTALRFRPHPTTGNPVLHTGDHGYLDDGGRFHFVGRHDDVFKLRGLRVSGAEIEAAAGALDGVDAAAVLAPVGTSPAVLVVSGSVSQPELVDHLMATIGGAKIPTRCRVVAELPYTRNGKVDRPALRARFGA
jgi:acyl-coenzyme A synthetase/AMP-(fatty) acid ligase